MTQFNTQLGLGTSDLGCNLASAAKDKTAIHYALDIGYTVIDTAEKYGNGKTEIVIGAALKDYGLGKRNTYQIVSKVLPINASKQGTIDACKASIRRLQCEYIDTYLLHWRGPVPLDETLEGFLELQQQALIKNYGVSSFDIIDLIEWRRAEEKLGVPAGIVTNQVYYSLSNRRIEKSLMKYQEKYNISTMAYSPLDQGKLLSNQTLLDIANEYNLSPAQLALAWTIRNPNVITIPKSGQLFRILSNYNASKLKLSDELISKMNTLFPIT
jgi:diketogulonate reductase-like aldo/keto reductase